MTPLTSTDELLGFTIKDTFGTIVATIKASDAGTPVNIPTGIRLDGIKPILTPNTDTGATGFQLLSTAVSSNNLIVADCDGDASITTNTSALGKIRVNLIQDGVAVAPSAATFTTCASSYSLEIEIDVLPGADKVTALTTYGDPNKKEYTGTTTAVIYNLKPQGAGICRIEPKDKTVQTASGLSLGGVSAEWITGKGFSVPALKAATPIKEYPLTGFRNAEFSLIGSDTNQANYTCKLASGGDVAYVTLSGGPSTTLGKDCTVTYKNKKIDKTIQIDMYDNTTLMDSYTIPVAKLWAGDNGTSTIKVYNTLGTLLNDPNAFKGHYDAANYCRASAKPAQSTLVAGLPSYKMASESFFKRAELTNAVEASSGYWFVNSSNVWQQVGTSATGGSYTRTADGTFMGEWGNVRNYANSPWSASFHYWTAEANSSSYQYSAISFGNVGAGSPAGPGVAAVCKR